VWKRYVVPCLLVLALAGGIAGGVYKLAKVDFVATCNFKATLAATSQQTQTDNLLFQAELAAEEFNRVNSGAVFTSPAAAVGIDAGTLAKNTTVGQGPGIPDFVVSVRDSDANRAGRAANLLCDQYVTQLKARREQERQSEVVALEKQLADLDASASAIQSTPPALRQPGDDLILVARQKAIQADQVVLATALAMAPDDIAIITHSAGGVRNDTRDLNRNLLVAGIAGLLACFLIILVGEITRETRQSG
jgi:hypothetical protein